MQVGEMQMISHYNPLQPWLYVRLRWSRVSHKQIDKPGENINGPRDIRMQSNKQPKLTSRLFSNHDFLSFYIYNEQL